MLDCIFDINEFQKLHSDELNIKIDEYFNESGNDQITNDQAVEMLMKVFKNYHVHDDDELLQFTLIQIVDIFDEDKNNQIDMNELINMMTCLTNFESVQEKTKKTDPQIAQYISKHILNSVKTKIKVLPTIEMGGNHINNDINREFFNNSSENTDTRKKSIFQQEKNQSENTDKLKQSEILLIKDDKIDRSSNENIVFKKENSKKVESDLNIEIDNSDPKTNVQSILSLDNTDDLIQSEIHLIIDDTSNENLVVKKENSKFLKKVESDLNIEIDNSDPKTKIQTNDEIREVFKESQKLFKKVKYNKASKIDNSPSKKKSGQFNYK